MESGNEIGGLQVFLSHSFGFGNQGLSPGYCSLFPERMLAFLHHRLPHPRLALRSRERSPFPMGETVLSPLGE